MQDLHAVRDHLTGTRVQRNRCPGIGGDSEFRFDAAPEEDTDRGRDAISLSAAGNNVAELPRPDHVSQ